MFEETIQFLLSPPARLKALGKILSGASALIIVAALYLRSGVMATGILQSMMKVKAPDSTLASLYPGLPTWFIPESLLGFAFWITAWTIGSYAMWFSRRFETVYGSP
jgi:hypothetical protein